GAPTDELAAAVFPDLAEDPGRRRVWRSISDVRAELGNVFARSGDRYLLDRTAVSIDVDEFDVLIARASTETDAARKRLLKQALALVRGDPLAGTDYPWPPATCATSAPRSSLSCTSLRNCVSPVATRPAPSPLRSVRLSSTQTTNPPSSSPCAPRQCSGCATQ